MKFDIKYSVDIDLMAFDAMQSSAATKCFATDNIVYKP